MFFRLQLINIKLKNRFLKHKISNLSNLGIDINDKKVVIHSKYSKILKLESEKGKKNAEKIEKKD